ncbi:MAG: efflux RND transporter periplasmic adaptor subunit [candidate division NC10 bacterium]|nr:efflux RND transporter periplasmic adaptor subunit [candidate division NC10 bacterium]
MPDTPDSLEAALQTLRIDPGRKKKGTRRRRSWVLYGVTGLFVVLAAGAFLLRGHLDPMEVEVAVAQRLDPGAPAPVLTAGGYIVPHRKIELAPRITGRVEWIGVEKADRVDRGQVVLRIEQREFLAAVDRAEAALLAARARLNELEAGSRPEEIERARAALEEARSNVANAALELDRFQRLYAEGAVSRQLLDGAKNRHEVALAQRKAAEQSYELTRIGPRQEQIDLARAQVREAEAALRAAQVDLDNTLIRAPVAGTILERLVEPGEIVTTSFIGGRGAKSAVLSMANLTVLDVEVDVSQNEFRKVRLNQPATIVPDAFPDRTYRGSLTELAPEANRQKATLQVKVRILDPDEAIRPEMNAKVTFLEPPGATPAGPPKVLVPKEAILPRQGQSLVYLANGSKAAGRPVKIGAEVDGKVEVLEGLQGGETVIVRGVEALRDGQRLRIKR